MRRKNIILIAAAVFGVLILSLLIMQSTFDLDQHAISKDDVIKTLPTGMVALNDMPFPDIPDALQTTPPFNINDYKGRKVLINFWASWCAPCRVEFPDLLEFADSHKNDLTLVFISNDRDPEKITRFLDSLSDEAKDILKTSQNIKLLNDPTQSFTRDVFQTYKLPETYAVSPKGFLEYKIIGVAGESHLSTLDAWVSKPRLQPTRP